jgi:hypothetical protein
MPQIIDVYQNSFVPMRHINDNIIIANEIMHSMRKMKDKKGLMTIKVDLKKAYEDFIKETMLEIGLPRRMVDLIMACIESSTLSVLWNGYPSDSFKPFRGIRQEDPFVSIYFYALLGEIILINSKGGRRSLLETFRN